MKPIFRSLAVALFCFGSATGQTAATDTLISMQLPPMDSSETIMLTVSYAPGEFSAPHRHDAHTFVYVLEGEIEMQVEGGELKRLRPGDTFYENPTDVHAVSRNVSDTAPAKFLVFFIKKPGAPVSVPVSAAAPHH